MKNCPVSGSGGQGGLCMGVQGLPVVMTKFDGFLDPSDELGLPWVDGEALQVHGGLGLWLCGAMLRL